MIGEPLSRLRERGRGEGAAFPYSQDLAFLPTSAFRTNPGSARMRERQKTRFARHLRQNMTDAEASLWHHLRNRALMGCKFRRQHPVGPYIVDFACIERKLVVELDGGQHVDDPKEAARTRWIEAGGYRVLRFWNNDALVRQQVVLAVILEALDVPPRQAAKGRLP